MSDSNWQKISNYNELFLTSKQNDSSPSDSKEDSDIEKCITLDTSDSEEQSDTEDENLSFEDKVKHLQDQFKSIPPLLIKKVLHRNDVKENLHVATNCLKAMSPSKGMTSIGLQVKTENSNEKKIPPMIPKKSWKEIGKGYQENENHEKRENKSLFEERTDNPEETGAVKMSESRRDEDLYGLGSDELYFEDVEDDAECMSIEGKIKDLQQSFKGFPPFVIRKILQRQDIKEDLGKARSCLENMSSLKGTFTEGEGNGEKAPKDQLNRRKAWEQKKGKEKGSQRENLSGKGDEGTSEHGEESADVECSGAEGNTGKNPQKKMRKNRGRNRKKGLRSPSQGQNERKGENLGAGPTEKFSLEDWQGGHLHQQWERAGYPQQPWRQRGYPQPSWRGGGFNYGGPRLRGSHFRGGNERGYPRGDGRDWQGGHPENYYYEDENVGLFPSMGSYCPYGRFQQYQRTKSEADIQMSRGKPRPRGDSREKDNSNVYNIRGRRGQNWVGRGTGRGAGQRQRQRQSQTVELENVPSREEIHNLEPNMILIRGLKKSPTFDAMRNFVEARCGDEVLDIAKMEKGMALVTLKKLSNFENAKQNMESRTIEGSKVTIHRVPVSTSIQVRNISPDTTHDALEFYFSNPRIGGEVTSIQYEKGNSQAVITFKNADVMRKVLRSKCLKLNEVNLIVETFNPAIQGTNQGISSKEEIAVAVDKDVMELAETTPSLEELKKSLRDLGFNMKYTSQDSIAYIVPITKGENSVNKERGIKCVTDFTKKFKTIELDVEEIHWTAVMTEIWKLQNDLGKGKVSVKESEVSKDKVTIICPIAEAQPIRTKFSEKIEETQALEEKKTHERQEMNIEEEKLVLLNKIGFKEEHLSRFGDLEVDINLDNGTMTIVGPKRQFSEAKILIYQHLSKMSERSFLLTRTVYEMLCTDEGLERIKLELKRKNLDAVFCIDEDNYETNTATVVGINKKHADEAADLIKSLTTEIKIKVDKDLMELLRTQKWNDLCEELKQDFKVYVRRNEYFDTWIAGFKGEVSSAHDRIKKFLDDNSIGTEKFCCSDKGVRRYIIEHRKEEIENMKSVLKPYSVKVDVGETADAFSISGTKIGLARLQDALHLLTDSVAVNSMKVHQPGLNKFVASERGERLIKSIEHEHKCVIEKVGAISQEGKNVPQSENIDDITSDSSLDESSESDREDDAQASYGGPMTITCGNVKISWERGRIERQKVDIIVGSTIGQLAKVFQRAGVPVVKQQRGNVSLITQCGNLPCKHVILTECCKWDGGNGGAERELGSIVGQCLQQALQSSASSIAFPVIGTGGLGFPNSTACKTMINEVIRVINGWGTSSLNDIRFVVFDQDPQLINTFQQEFSVASGLSGTSVPISEGLHGFLFSLYHTPSSMTMNSFGNVSVQVLQGDLVLEQTDAIVNINATDMNMQNAGALSKAVAAAAGTSVQDECTALGNQIPGSAVITKAGNLSVNRIIHAIPQKADEQHIQSCIEQCLRVADSNMLQSISIPSFGTGSYGMADSDSARATFQAFANVCPNLQNVKQVRIVIFQPQMVSTFQQTLQLYTTSSYNQSVPRKPPVATRKMKHSPSRRETSIMDGTMKPIQFRLFGKNKDCVERAQIALTKGFTEVCVTKTVENEDASKLSGSQRKKLTTKARQLDVTVKFEDKIRRVVVRGDPDDVSSIINDIWEEIQERTKKEKEKEQAEVLHKAIKWQYELLGKTKYFHKITNAAIEKAHSSNNSRVTVKVHDEKYVIVFSTNTGTGLSTGQTMSVTRTTVGSSAEGIALPKEWCPMPQDGSGKEMTVHLVQLANVSPEYQKVQNMFQITGGSGQIIKIERIQNPHLYQQYMVRKQKMDRDNKGLKTERQLFHGTSSKNVNDINTTGFNRSYCGAHGVAYGKGVYFARDASYSMRYAQSIGNQHHFFGQLAGPTGGKPMYLARVLTGQYAQGDPNMIVPPKGFDSVANSTGPGANIFVVFYDSQCYPEYLITFQ